LRRTTPGASSISYLVAHKWVFKVKWDEHGAMSKHKAHLMVKGNAQRHDINYDEVFAPVAQLDSMHLLITLAAHEGWTVHHTGFIIVAKEHKVLKLWKALYELHQASRTWNVKLDDTLLSLGFRRTPSEHTIYIW
jgi:hypothetical protein